jgi:hypothetical protein
MAKKDKITGERWGIWVDGIKLSNFNSKEEADEHKEKHLKGKDVEVFPFFEPAKKQEEEDHYTPGHA